VCLSDVLSGCGEFLRRIGRCALPPPSAHARSFFDFPVNNTVVSVHRKFMEVYGNNVMSRWHVQSGLVCSGKAAVTPKSSSKRSIRSKKSRQQCFGSLSG